MRSKKFTMQEEKSHTFMEFIFGESVKLWTLIYCDSSGKTSIFVLASK